MSHHQSSLRAITVTVFAASAALLLASSVHAQNSQTFNGNGAAGFGGTLGGGSIKVSSTTSAVTFLFNPSGSFGGNDVILYLDTKTGGVGSTVSFTDNGDGGREAISGNNAGNASRTLATFASGFTADYAIDFEPGTMNLFDLSTPTNFGFVTGATPASGGPYSLTITDAQLGLTPGSPLRFVATFISQTAYRSNETVGTSTTTPGSVGDTPNAGFSGSTTFSNFNTFVTNAAAPEPGDLAMVTFGASLLGGAFLARRRRATK